MNATALAQTLEASKNPDGTLSLHELQRRLEDAGFHELSRAAAALAARLTPRPLRFDQTVPWI